MEHIDMYRENTYLYVAYVRTSLIGLSIILQIYTTDHMYFSQGISGVDRIFLEGSKLPRRNSAPLLLELGACELI